MNNAELKPCPFCGGKASLFDARMFVFFGPETYKAICSVCDADAGNWQDTEELAIAAWNHRVEEKRRGERKEKP